MFDLFRSSLRLVTSTALIAVASHAAAATSAPTPLITIPKDAGSQYTYMSAAGIYPTKVTITNPTGRGYVYSQSFDARPLYLGINGKDYLTINLDGSVSVTNTLFAKEIRVQANPFPDYVFEPGYRLRTLDEVAAEIATNHRLPGIPSAEEIQKTGLPVSELAVKQMEKIEELTLYAIDLKQRNDALAEQNAALEKRLARLEAAVGLTAGK